MSGPKVEVTVNKDGNGELIGRRELDQSEEIQWEVDTERTEVDRVYAQPMTGEEPAEDYTEPPRPVEKRPSPEKAGERAGRDTEDLERRLRDSTNKLRGNKILMLTMAVEEFLKLPAPQEDELEHRQELVNGLTPQLFCICRLVDVDYVGRLLAILGKPNAYLFNVYCKSYKRFATMRERGLVSNLSGPLGTLISRFECATDNAFNAVEAALEGTQVEAEKEVLRLRVKRSVEFVKWWQEVSKLMITATDDTYYRRNVQLYANKYLVKMLTDFNIDKAKKIPVSGRAQAKSMANLWINFTFFTRQMIAPFVFLFVDAPLVPCGLLAFASLWLWMPMMWTFSALGLGLQTYRTICAFKSRVDTLKHTLYLICGILCLFIMVSWWYLRRKASSAISFVKEGRKKKLRDDEKSREDDDPEPTFNGVTIVALIGIVLSSLGIAVLPFMGILEAGKYSQAGKHLSNSVTDLGKFAKTLGPMAKGFFSYESQGDPMKVYFYMPDGRLGVFDTFTSEKPITSKVWVAMEYIQGQWKQVKNFSDMSKVIFVHYTKIPVFMKSGILGMQSLKVYPAVSVVQNNKGEIILLEACSEEELKSRPLVPINIAGFSVDVESYAKWVDEIDKGLKTNKDHMGFVSGGIMQGAANPQSSAQAVAATSGGYLSKSVPTAPQRGLQLQTLMKAPKRILDNYISLIKSGSEKIDWSSFPLVLAPGKTDVGRIAVLHLLTYLDFHGVDVVVYINSCLDSTADNVAPSTLTDNLLLRSSVEEKGKEKETEDSAEEYAQLYAKIHITFPLWTAEQALKGLRVPAIGPYHVSEGIIVQDTEWVQEVGDEPEITKSDEERFNENELYGLARRFRKNCCQGAGRVGTFFFGTHWASLRFALFMVCLISLAMCIALYVYMSKKKKRVPMKAEGDFIIKYNDGKDDVPTTLMSGSTLAIDLAGKTRYLQIQKDLETTLKNFPRGIPKGDYSARLIMRGGSKMFPVKIEVPTDVPMPVRYQKEKINHRRRFAERQKVDRIDQLVQEGLHQLSPISTQVSDVPSIGRKPELLTNLLKEISREASAMKLAATTESGEEPACVHVQSCPLSACRNTSYRVPCHNRCGGKDCVHSEDCVVENDLTLAAATFPSLDWDGDRGEAWLQEAFMCADVANRYSKVIRAGNNALGSSMRVMNCGLIPYHFVEQIKKDNSSAVVVENISGSLCLLRPEEGWDALFRRIEYMYDTAAFPLPVQGQAWSPPRIQVLPEGWVGKLKVFGRHLQTGLGMDTVEVVVKNGQVHYNTDHFSGMCGSIVALDDQNFTVVGFHTDGAKHGQACRGPVFTEKGLAEIAAISRLSPLSKNGGFASSLN